MAPNEVLNGDSLPIEATQNAELRDTFEQLRPLFELRTLAMTELCSSILEELQGVPHYLEKRTKTVHSFMRKASEPPFENRDPIKNMHDISGLRIIVVSLGDAEKVTNLLRAKLEVDELRSMAKGSEFSPDRFGYRSRHLICRADEVVRSSTEWEGADGWTEIQIRSACQNAWAQVDRLVRYKTAKDLSYSLQRRLFSLAAVLEVCDSEIEGVFDEWEALMSSASESIRTNPDVRLAEDVFAAYIQSDPKISDLERMVNVCDIRIRGLSHLGRDLRILNSFGVVTVGDMDTVLAKAMPWANTFYENFFKELRDARLATDSLEKNALVTLLVIASHHPLIDETALRRNFGYGLGWTILAAIPG
jgi:ppGpp synthetase/RelA/SpoT-type nucleotidyltranferase